MASLQTFQLTGSLKYGCRYCGILKLLIINPLMSGGNKNVPIVTFSLPPGIKG